MIPNTWLFLNARDGREGPGTISGGNRNPSGLCPEIFPDYVQNYPGTEMCEKTEKAISSIWLACPNQTLHILQGFLFL